MKGINRKVTKANAGRTPTRSFRRRAAIQSSRLAVSSVALVFTLLLHPAEVRSQGLRVDCDSGGTIRAALAGLKPGDTLTVSGTCSESISIEGEVSRITLDGRGSATIQSPAPNQNVIAIRGREITVRGFTLRGGNNGIVIQRDATAVIDGNTVRGNRSNGILVGPQSSASIINNTIENNLRGISVDENSSARIGWQVPTLLGLPNTIQNSTEHAIHVLHNSSARIIGATIKNNGGDGVRVERASHVDISDNSISGNGGNGITASGNSAVDLDLGRIQATAPPNRTDAGQTNGGFGIACLLGSQLSGSLGTLTGAKGAIRVDLTCVDGSLTVSGVSFDPVNVPPGGSFVATFSGAGLSPQTYFDIRFRAPGNNTDQEAFNWQQGTSAPHAVAASTQAGAYAVTAVRAHTDAAEHSGPYIPVSASLAIRP